LAEKSMEGKKKISPLLEWVRERATSLLRSRSRALKGARGRGKKKDTISKLQFREAGGGQTQGRGALLSSLGGVYLESLSERKVEGLREERILVSRGKKRVDKGKQ